MRYSEAAQRELDCEFSEREDRLAEARARREELKAKPLPRPSQIPAALVVDPDEAQELSPSCLDDPDYCLACGGPCRDDDGGWTECGACGRMVSPDEDGCQACRREAERADGRVWGCD